MKRITHTLMLIVGFFAWLLGTLFYSGAMALAVLGDRLISTETFGNCWTHALTRYHRRGGYLIIRPADDVRFLGRFGIPHVIWCRVLPDDIQVEQFVPKKRSRSQWLPWKTIWYEGRIRRRERPHPGAEQPETKPGNLDDLFND